MFYWLFGIYGNLLLLLPNPYQLMGIWRETMDAKKPSNFLMPEPEVKYRKAEQRVRS